MSRHVHRMRPTVGLSPLVEEEWTCVTVALSGEFMSFRGSYKGCSLQSSPLLFL